MALYDRNQTRSFFSELAHEQDICYYCEKTIREKRNNREIDLDEMNKQLKGLRGAIANVRVPKLRYVGHEMTICPNCLKSICEEVLPKETDTKTVEVEAVEEIKADTKAKGKGNKNASKES